MFEDSIRYPYDEGEGLRAIAIGGILTMLGFLIIPVVFVSGYVLRVLRNVIAGDEHPPAFDDWTNLFVDGLKVIVVAVVYLFVPLVLVGGSLAAVFVPVASQPPAWVSTLATIVALLSLPTLFAAAYVLPAGLINLARTDSMSSAFAFLRLWPVLKSGSYGVGWLLALAVTLAAGLLTSFVGAVAVFGWVLVAFVTFYANVVAAYLYARGFADSGAAPTTNVRGTDAFDTGG